MSEKERTITTVNLTVENVDWMDENISNRSDFINDLVAGYRRGGNTVNKAVAEFRAEQLRSKLKSLEQRKEGVEEELSKLEDLMENTPDQYEQEIESFVETLQKGGDLFTDHAKVKSVAEKHAKTPEMVLSDVREYKEKYGIQSKGEIR